MQKFKRKKKLINKSLQLKMVGIFTAIGCTCALFQVILINSGLLKVAKAAPSGGEEILRQARGMMVENVAWTLGSMIPLMTCIGIVLTHRIAGPAYRMTEHCKAIAAGEPVTTCKIRKGDELRELCDALNAAIDHLAPAEADPESYTEKWSLEESPTLLAPESKDSESKDSAADDSKAVEATEESQAA
jgi:hypothetical protein